MKTTSQNSSIYEKLIRKTFFRDVVLMSLSCGLLAGFWHVLFCQQPAGNLQENDRHHAPFEVLVTETETSGPVQNGFWLRFRAKFWPLGHSQLCILLGQTWAMLGSCWAMLTLYWAMLGLSWVYLGSFGGHVNVEPTKLAYSGTCWFGGPLQPALLSILSGIYSSTWHFFLAFYLASILTFYLPFFSGILPGMYSGIYFDILPDWRSRLRSGSAHCGLELAVEVRQCTPLPEETEEEGRKEGKRKEKATVIKSRDPHLAAGERKTEQQKSREAKQTKKHKRTEQKSR